MAKPLSRAKRIKAIKKTLDKKSKAIAKERDGHTCIMCGAKDSLHSHHWAVSKAHSQRLAYDPDNLATLCFSCHIIKVHRRADGLFVAALFEKMREIVGAEKVHNLMEIASHPRPLSLEDLEGMLEGLSYAS